MSDEKLQRLVHKSFEFYGLKIEKKLSAKIAKGLVNHENPSDWLTKIAEQILTQNLTTGNVDLENIQLAIKETSKPESTLKDTETIINVINAFTVPKVTYDLYKKKYVIGRVEQEIFPDAEHKSILFKERLDLLWYRTQKHPSFAPSKFKEDEENKLQLTPLEFLLSESKTKDVCVMGLLAQLTEGQYYLEDYGGSVKINLKETSYDSSLIVEGSIVIARGRYTDGVLQVENICFPPAEHSEPSRANFSDANTFGGAHPFSLKQSTKLKSYEDEHRDDGIIFISDLWLDNESALHEFRTILSGFSDYPPIAFVLCGHFLSSPADVASARMLKEGFRKLAGLIAEFPQIRENSKFVLVPGPYDLGAPKILPRPPLPECLLKDFREAVPGTYLATNPCRIQYCTKEIVVFRENMLSKLCRNTLCYPKRQVDEDGREVGEQVYEAFAKSIIRQSHLAPLLFSVVPVYWKHDQALQLYPTPDLIVVADDFQPYSTTYYKCHVINPGPFVKSNFSFKLYCPAEDRVDNCGSREMDESEF